MNDDFDRALKSALGPDERDEDCLFVLRVTAAIRLDEQLRSARRAILRSLCVKLAALAGVAAALLWIGQTTPVRHLAGDSPWIAVAFLVLIFGALTALIGSEGETPVFSAA